MTLAIAVVGSIVKAPAASSGTTFTKSSPRLHHAREDLLRQPHHLDPMRHHARQRPPIAHEDGLQHHPAAQRLTQEVVALHRHQPTA